MNSISGTAFTPAPEGQRGLVIPLGEDVDEAYIDRLKSLVLDPETVKKQPLKIVYSSLHGVGGVIIRPLLEQLGFQLSVVESQEIPDGRFPTVKSPNPENPEALTLAIAQADKEQADLVMATDPDDDRLGAAVRGSDGKMHLLTGNQLGSLMAAYRVQKFFDLGILNDSNRGRATIVKTFVTTGLQEAIASHYGIRCVDTLTGFKYIGEKLNKYELAIPSPLRDGYRTMSEPETRALRLAHSTFFVFGGEESYGYSGSDFVRDKDGNAAAVMLAEVAAHARSRGLTLIDLLDELYLKFGYYLERGEAIVMDGAAGAKRIQTLVTSYAKNPPESIGGHRVEQIQNFATVDIFDSEGDKIPKESMLSISLKGGFRIAIRPSGTEPKIKYYLFANRPPLDDGESSRESLSKMKCEVNDALESLWQAILADAHIRSGD